jgi:hypothetical protein
MAVYFGVVKGSRVELEGDAQIADGARVEVRPVALEAQPAGPGTTDTAAAERALLRDLLAAGLLDHMPVDEAAPDEPFEPVVVQGRPLSEQIIDERR